MGAMACGVSTPGRAEKPTHETSYDAADVKTVTFEATRIAALEHRGDPFTRHFQMDLCAATQREIEPNSFGVVERTIPGGRCAMLRHVGSDDTLGENVMFLYSTWLPESGEELRDYPLYLQRVRFFPEVPEHEALTDVFLPLR